MISKLPIYFPAESPVIPTDKAFPVKFYLYKGYPIKRNLVKISDNWVSVNG